MTQGKELLHKGRMTTLQKFFIVFQDPIMGNAQ
jgi:hypothetical protein